MFLEVKLLTFALRQHQTDFYLLYPKFRLHMLCISLQKSTQNVGLIHLPKKKKKKFVMGLTCKNEFRT